MGQDEVGEASKNKTCRTSEANDKVLILFQVPLEAVKVLVRVVTSD